VSDVLQRMLAGLRTALVASPDNGPLWAQVGDLLGELGRESEAAEAYAEAVRHLDGAERARVQGLLDELRPPEEDDDDGGEEHFGGKLTVLRGGKQRPPRDAEELTQPERERKTFGDVGGLEDVKDQVRMKIVLPFQKPEIFAAYGKKRGGGLLMYGPPGCGKTLLARATAGEVGATFMNVSIDSVLDMWFGESEKKLAQLFADARSKAPTVLFFDEVEAVGGSRQQLRSSAGKTLVNQLLSEMDGHSSNNDRLLVMAATNAPWHVDSALLRPGRFDRVLFVPPPDAEARLAILKLLTRSKPLDRKVDFKKLVKKTKGFSGADLEDLVDRALEAPLKDALRTGEIRDLTQKDFDVALKGARSSVKDWFATAKNYATFANAGGLYDDLSSYLEGKHD
jgi:transitional endoplasmic reticulum ATPase